MASFACQVLLALCAIVLASADEDYKHHHPPRPTPPPTTTTTTTTTTTPPPTTTTPRTTPRPGCLRASDCPYGSCCLLNKTTNRGVCKPLQASRQTCYWSQVHPRPNPLAMVTKYDLCPCGHEMACTKLVGKSHPVFGPIGICTWD
ncbi:adipocyte plasma membrane-associated protein Hemomucin-like [Physella acuta]|uniref:adipocyte plasma membrane-associated protein Hemomucin-like n=1 Tax=Physella acuta TaxID=109671 RepID=UPI0027DACAF5|nr:adipocyte plasma membrane-associated protein Hemomucin-like [Physella acuta]